MQTRSQTKSQAKLYEVNIDFDDPSEAWRLNKKSVGNGSYKYICCAVKTSGEKCGIKCIHGEQYCKRHYKQLDHRLPIERKAEA